MQRNKARKPSQLRQTKIIKNYIKHPHGSVLIQVGQTKVICSASVEEKVPSFLRDKKTGWLTAEYSMMPSSTHTRSPREASRGKLSGRTQEIQRLIGRSLRAVLDLKDLGERTIWIDCDVVQADGGTRCASITGSFVALCLALKKLKKQKLIKNIPVKDFVAAVSVGIFKGKIILDLDYDEDSKAEVDMNIIKTGKGQFVEVQGTAESKPFDEKQMEGMINLANKGIQELIALQKAAVGTI